MTASLAYTLYSMDKFLVTAYSQQAKEVIGGAGDNTWHFGRFVSDKWDIGVEFIVLCSQYLT